MVLTRELDETLVLVQELTKEVLNGGEESEKELRIASGRARAACLRDSQPAPQEPRSRASRLERQAQKNWIELREEHTSCGGQSIETMIVNTA